MDNINVEYDNLTETGNNIVELSEKFSEEVRKINENVNKIEKIWSGKDSEIYLNRMRNEYIQNLNELSNILNEYGKYLLKVERGYELLDSTFASRKIEE